MPDDTEVKRAVKRAERRAKLKRAAQLRAEINFRHALERIDHRLDVVDPALEEIEQRVAEGEMPRELG